MVFCHVDEQRRDSDWRLWQYLWALIVIPRPKPGDIVERRLDRSNAVSTMMS
jgi:hypothetical protein